MDRTRASAARTKDDLRLAGRCLAGDEAAQHELFHRERRRVHATLYRILGSNTDMEDLVQEAFLEIFRSLGGFRGEAMLATWVDRVTARVAYQHLTRARSRRGWQQRPLQIVPELPAGDPSAEQRVAARQACRSLYRVLEGLPARQRIAFSLHVIDGRPLAEVATVMEASVVATKVRVWRARRKIEHCARREPALAGFLAGPARAPEGET